MSFSWSEWSNPVAIWWICLSLIAVFNMSLWIYTCHILDKNKRVKELIYLSGIYVFGCAFRSFFPKADVQRLCLFDTWFSSVLLGRTVATVAELAFICQWAIIIHLLAQQCSDKKVEKISFVLVPIIFLAECFSWYAVITTNYIGNTVEESLWACTYLIIGFSLLSLRKKMKSFLRKILEVSILGCVFYFLFMIFVDVPMYFSRWQLDLENQRVFLNLTDGLRDLNSRWIVSHSIIDWRQEIPWMTLYFSFAVWTSIGICYVPKLSRAD